MRSRIAGVRGEFLWELEIATRQMIAMGEATPPAMYKWRPEKRARSVSEVLVHVATGNFMLLDAIGIAAPTDLYPGVPMDGPERFSGLLSRNDELLVSLEEKPEILALLQRSLEAVARSLRHTNDEELERGLHFFGERTTVRRVYLRLLTHTHEHMGQMIAYLRCNGIPPPWPDWRPDRRSQG